MKAASHIDATLFFTAPSVPAWTSRRAAQDRPATRRTATRPGVIVLEDDGAQAPEIVIRTVLMLCTVFGLVQCALQFANF
jgi:hypothetical protein